MSFLLQAATTSWIKDVDEWLGAIDHTIVIVGVPWAIIGHFRARKKELAEKERLRLEMEQGRHARELATYDALDEKYLEFEQLCLSHPELDVFDVPDASPIPRTPMLQKRELIAFTMLFSIFERAFYMYRGQDDAIRRAQWTGWDEFIAAYCARPNFQAAWARSGTTFDTDFQTYMNGKVGNGRQNAAPRGP